MKLFRFTPEVGRKVALFNSVNVTHTLIAQLAADARISCMYVGPQGRVGYHQAVTPQWFLIVEGEGWVRGEPAAESLPIRQGQAAFWEKGEWHAAGTETGLTAIVIEGETLTPSEFKLPEM